MKKRKVEEIILQLVFFVIGLVMMIGLLFVIKNSMNTALSSKTQPVLAPSTSMTTTATTSSAISTTFENSRNSFYMEILKQASHSFDTEAVAQSISSGFAMTLLSWLTGIDVGNPTACLESQIRLLSFADPKLLETPPQGNVANADDDDEDGDGDDDGNIKPGVLETQKPPVKDTKEQDDKSAKNGKEIKETLKTLKTKQISIKKAKLNSKKPLVLIYHSHTTESFQPDNNGNNFAPKNPELTVDAVGEQLAQTLQQDYGIATLHESTIHDFPKRLGAYVKSRPTVQQYLKKYPSLKLIIDLHRDGDVPRVKCTAVIDGQNYARTLLVAGAKFKKHESYNKTTQKVKAIFDKYFPDFCRGIDYKSSSYNQDLSSKMILLEVGSNKNNLAEALKATEIVAKVIAKYLGL